MKKSELNQYLTHRCIPAFNSVTIPLPNVKNARRAGICVNHYAPI
nr:MAG TPA_asm: hypothetical protein [Caudoviricetes sp.]